MFTSLVTNINLIETQLEKYEITKFRIHILPWEKEKFLTNNDIHKSELHELYCNDENEDYLQILFALKLHSSSKYIFGIWQFDKKLHTLNVFLNFNAEVYAALVHNVFKVPQDHLVMSLFYHFNITINRPSLFEQFHTKAAYLLNDNYQSLDDLANTLKFNINSLKHEKNEKFTENLAKYIILRRDGYLSLDWVNNV